MIATQTKNSPTKYFIYCRKSSEDTQRQVASIGDQLDALKKVVDANGLTVVGTFTEEKSSKDPGREVFNDMLKRISAGEADGILCWDNDRLSRNPIDSGNIAWMLQRGVLKVIMTPGRSYYPEDAGLLLSVEQGRATDYVIRLSKNVKRGLHGKAMRGWRPSGGPIGYRNEGLEKGSKTIGIDPERFDLIRRMWDLFLTGHYSVRELHTIVNEQWGLRTPQKRKLGGKKLSMSHLYVILNDRFYTGKFPWKDPETAEIKLYKGLHLPMITEREFERAQVLLGGKGKPQPQTREFSFTGLAHCGECHSAITAEEKNQIICTGCKYKFAYENKTTCPKCSTSIEDMRNPTILNYVYYRCSKKKVKCSQKYIRREDFETQIEEYLKHISIDPEYIKVALDYLRDHENVQIEDHKKIVESLRLAVAQCQKRIDNLMREFTSSQNEGYVIFTPQEFSKHKQQLLEERDRLKDELDRVDQRSDKAMDMTVRTFNFCSLVLKTFQTGDLKMKRVILQTIGSNMTLKDKKLSIQLLNPFSLIENELASQGALLNTLEPRKYGSNKGKASTFVPAYPDLLRE